MCWARVQLSLRAVQWLEVPWLSFTGRYNKYSRNLPQTPWIIDGERKLESSVEELISEHLMAEFKADSKSSGDLLPYVFFITTRRFFS